MPKVELVKEVIQLQYDRLSTLLTHDLSQLHEALFSDSRVKVLPVGVKAVQELVDGFVGLVE